MSDCSNHKKDIAGITDMKFLAELIGDLHYEVLPILFRELSDKFKRDAFKDLRDSKQNLYESLISISDNQRDAFVNAHKAWLISRPFMKVNKQSK